MNAQQQRDTRFLLEGDEAERDRGVYDYTYDAVRDGGIGPYVIWPEPNFTARAVIKGMVDYNHLPIDEENEVAKGGLFCEQQDIIERHSGQEKLCEALEMRLCLEEKCPLYDPSLGPPICREFKMVFRRTT